MKRGEIWWADVPPPTGRRPVLLLSRDRAYLVRTWVTVALVTTKVRDLPVEVTVGESEGLRKRSVVNLDNIMTIPKQSLERVVGQLPQAKMRDVEAAIHYALALED